MSEKTNKTKRKWRMPSAFAIIFGITAFMAVLTWIVPSGAYDLNKDGEPKAGTYHQVDKVRTEKDEKTGEETTVDVRQGVYDVLKAPVQGTLRVENPEGAISVMLFVLILGGFLGIVMKTGALDAMFGSIIRKLKGKEIFIIPILMTFFAIGGTTYGMQEETVAFYALVVPLILAAGYNGLTAAMIIILGAGVGVLGSTINPFSTGTASNFAGVSIGDGLIPRLIILVLCLVTAIAATMMYASKVKAGKYANDSRASLKETLTAKTGASADVPEFTTRRKIIASIFGLTFLLMILSVIPWEGKFKITFFADIHKAIMDSALGAILGKTVVPFGDWYFNELSTLFFTVALIIGGIHFWGKRTDDEDENLFGTFINGSKDLLAVALIIGFARGVSVVMMDGQIMSTIIHAGEELLRNVNAGFLPGLAFLVYLPLSFLVPSTSGLATASMPILAPLAEFANLDKSFIVTAFATASGVINMIAPTVASVMGGLVLAKVSYGTWVKRTWWIMVAFSVISIAVMTIFAVL